ncbi:MAG: hypothetical protein BVN35_06075 [Proteobacteria bacterium ST_bin11]|nr:MAG: hypothetical protein BVN35_06075 [Proteobacteria bacterium ST_bin11]
MAASSDATLQAKLRELFARRSDPGTDEDKARLEAEIKEVKDQMTAIHAKSHRQQVAYNQKLVGKSSASAINLHFFVVRPPKIEGSGTKRVCRFLASAILPFLGAAVKAPFGLENSEHTLVCKFKEGAVKQKARTPVRTARIHDTSIIEIAIWNVAEGYVPPAGPWLTFSGVKFSENFSEKTGKWYFNANADSCTPWLEAPIHAQLPELFKRFHTGVNFFLRPCDMSEFPTQSTIMDYMKETEAYRDGDDIDYDKRRESCRDYISKYLETRPHLRFFDPWGRQAVAFYFTNGSIYQNDVGEIPKEAPVHSYLDLVRWKETDDTLQEVKKKKIESGGAGAELDGSVAAAAASSSSSAQPTKVVVEYPFEKRFNPSAQADLKTSDGLQAIIDIGFPGTGLQRAFGILNPEAATVLIIPNIHNAKLAFTSTIEVTEFIFNDANALTATLPREAQKPVLTFKTFGSVFTNIVEFIRKTAFPVTSKYALQTLSKYISSNGGGSGCIDLDVFKSSSSTPSLSSKIYSYYTAYNDLAKQTNGNVFNILEQSPFVYNPATKTSSKALTRENAEDWHFYSLSNIVVDEAKLVEYRVRSEKYFAKAGGDPDEKAYLESMKTVFTRELEDLLFRGEGGEYFLEQKGSANVVYAVHKRLDADPDFHIYKNKLFDRSLDDTVGLTEAKNSCDCSGAASSVPPVEEGTPVVVSQGATSTVEDDEPPMSQTAIQFDIDAGIGRNDDNDDDDDIGDFEDSDLEFDPEMEPFKARQKKPSSSKRAPPPSKKGKTAKKVRT